MKKSIVSIMLLMLTFASVMFVMTRPVKAEIIVFTAQLLAANEVPPVAVVSPSETGASGFVTVTLDNVANTMQFQVSMSGLNNSSPIILSHIHQAAAGVNGPVVVDSGISPGAPVPVNNGVAAYTRSNLPLSAALAAQIVANPAGFYFNVHTLLSPGGVSRGQLVRQASSTPGTAAPTLSEWGVILMTLLFIAVCTLFIAGRSKTASAVPGAETPFMFARSFGAIDWRLLARVTLYVEAAVVLVLIAIRPGPVDVLGAVTSGLAVAFIVHLLIGSARHR